MGLGDGQRLHHGSEEAANHTEEKLVCADQPHCAGENRLEVHRHVFKDGAWALPNLRGEGKIFWRWSYPSTEKGKKGEDCRKNRGSNGGGRSVSTAEGQQTFGVTPPAPKKAKKEKTAAKTEEATEADEA